MHNGFKSLKMMTKILGSKVKYEMVKKFLIVCIRRSKRTIGHKGDWVSQFFFQTKLLHLLHNDVEKYVRIDFYIRLFQHDFG